jgi:hypothetical protein
MRLFLGRLAPSVTVDEICSLLDDDLSVVTHLYLKQSYGFVDFASDAAAITAIHKLRGML